jgi:K+-sensing histidine kinase KdpD
MEKAYHTRYYLNYTKFATSDSTTGTGLGLYICKNIIEAQGSRISAEIILMIKEQPLDLHCPFHYKLN